MATGAKNKSLFASFSSEKEDSFRHCRFCTSPLGGSVLAGDSDGQANGGYLCSRSGGGLNGLFSAAITVGMSVSFRFPVS
jgi:hypothetical protein